MTQKFANNGRALLQGAIGPADTSLTVEAAKADRFPVGTTTTWVTPLDWFKVTLVDSAGNIEIVKVGTRTPGSGVFSNVLRAQDGTTALSFAIGSVAVHSVTAADVEATLAGTFVDVDAQTLDVSGRMRQGAVEGRFTPVGGIIMWSGAIGAIPAGWALCNGTNGTPNLLDKMVIGAGSTYAVAASGGSKDAVVISHSHTVSASGFTGVESNTHTHGVSDPGHAHSFNVGGPTGGPLANSDSTTPGSTNNTNAALTGISLGTQSANHTHSTTVTGTAATTGVAGTDKNLPPYYALAFIMCLVSP